MTLVDVVVQMALGILLTAYVVRRDIRRLSAEQRARTWTPASFWVSVVVFGPLCIPVHFVKARRSMVGLLLGLLWMAAVLAVLSAVAEIGNWLVSFVESPV